MDQVIPADQGTPAGQGTLADHGAAVDQPRVSPAHGLLSGRRILVTGGSRGIGRAVVEASIQAGGTCAVLARSRESLDQAQDYFLQRGYGQIASVQADITDASEINEAVDQAADRLNGLDVLVNCAARVSSNLPDGVFTTTPELMISDFTEKVVGYLLCARASHPYLKAGGRGRIVNIGGEAVHIAHQNVSSGARNAALVHLTRSLAMELGPDGIRVNAVHPGVVMTESVQSMLTERSAELTGSGSALVEKLAGRNAIRRMIEPADIANVVVFLASNLADGVTGEAITVSGGSSRSVHY